MSITLYGIKACDTMKKARTWLDEQGVSYSFHDYKTSAIDAASLEKVSSKLAAVYAKDTLREGAAGYQKIKSDLQATASRMESMLAYAELQNALVRVCNTLGIDPVQGTGESLSPAELAKMIEDNLRKANADMR